MFSSYGDNFPYSFVTDQLRKGFPKWTRIRKDPNCVGSQFLNVFGLELNDIYNYLEYALKNQTIRTANIGELAFIYKTSVGLLDRDNLPSVLGIDDEGEHPITECYTLFEFYSSEAGRHVGIFDFDEGLFYVRQPYNSIRIGSKDYTSIKQHHVWNCFDEFALLLGLRRRSNEENVELKERILDVFRFPANSTRLGLIRAIGRELGLVYRAIWPGDQEQFVIDGSANRVKIMADTIIIDGRSAEKEQYDYDPTTNTCKFSSRYQVFYRQREDYEFNNTRINKNKQLVLVEGQRFGYMLTPVVYPINLKNWLRAAIESTGNARIDVVKSIFSSPENQSDQILATNIITESDLSFIGEPVRIMVTLSRGIRTDPSPTVSSLVLHYLPKSAEVAFIHDVGLEALHDDQFRNGLFNGDGSPSEKLKGYVNELNELVPIMWGKWKWDESYWDVIEKNLMGLHVLPNIWDPRLGEISSTYFQTGIGATNDLKVAFFDDFWSPQIHSGYYYITRKETIISDGSAMIRTENNCPEFVSVYDSSGQGYQVVETNANNLTIRPVPAVNAALTVLYGAEYYLYANSKTVDTEGPVSELLIDIPKQDAPVIIEGTIEGRRVVLKQVAFLDNDGNLNIRNRETVFGNGSTDLYLTYGPAIDVKVSGENITEVQDNRISLDRDLQSGKSVEVDYMVKDSFVMRLVGDKVLLSFSGQYSDFSVTYESEKDSAYYKTSGPSFDPMLSHINSGFLYIAQEIPELTVLDVEVFPDVIKGNGYDFALIVVDALDHQENPVLNKVIAAAIEQAIDEEGEILESPGTLSQVGSYYNRTIFRYLAPNLPYRAAKPSGWIPHGADATDWSRYQKTAKITLSFLCGAVKETVEIKVR
jgi:hypothetical protein